MRYADAAARLADYRRQIGEIRKRMREAQDAAEPQEVENYRLAGPAGPVQLSKLFGRHTDLIVIFNMGTSCPYCTLWADGFNGIQQHLVTRAAFVVSSPDAPEVQQSFATGRGWQFPMVSHQGTTFAADMGYRGPKGDWRPGISVFKREGARILRVADTDLHPGDDFCSLWHLFELLPQGAAGWTPKFSYP